MARKDTAMPSRRTGSVRQKLYALDKQLQKELILLSTNFGEEVAAALSRGTRKWHNKPAFINEVKVSKKLIKVTVKPVKNKAGQIFLFVEKGTGKYGPKKRPYQIPKVPKPETTLRFQTKYSALTKPVGIFGAGSGKKSGPWRSAKVVMHPGIKPRFFTQAFFKQTTPRWKRDIDNAFKRAARRAR